MAGVSTRAKMQNTEHTTNKCKCSKRVKEEEQAVQCEYCDIWYHNKCVGISEEQLKVMGDIGKTNTLVLRKSATMLPRMY